MNTVFYLSAGVAILATLLTVTSTRAVHALLYLVVSFLAIAVVFYTIGAPFMAALEVIVYAGAIVVLFLFVVMMLNIGDAAKRERQWLSAGVWFGPAALCLILLGELFWIFVSSTNTNLPGVMVSSHHIGMLLYGPYLLAVELASMLLLAGVVGAYDMGRRLLNRSPHDESEEV